jgi:predicted ribosomally synthesized peptide with nif11-like leader
MSVENLKKYGKMCSEDENVRAKAKEIGLQDIDGQIAHAKTLGLEFSKEDFEALAKEAGLEKKDELNEEELKKVAGGLATLTGLTIAAVVAMGAVSISTAGAVTKPGW